MTDKPYINLQQLSDLALLELIGNKIRQVRLSQNRNQEEVANAAGISRSTLSLLERGEVTRTDSLIQVLRVLNSLHLLQNFEIHDEVSPLEYLKLKKKQRKQASPKKSTNDEEELGW